MVAIAATAVTHVTAVTHAIAATHATHAAAAAATKLYKFARLARAMYCLRNTVCLDTYSLGHSSTPFICELYRLATAALPKR